MHRNEKKKHIIDPFFFEEAMVTCGRFPTACCHIPAVTVFQ
jgi:hypothetical protein